MQWEGVVLERYYEREGHMLKLYYHREVHVLVGYYQWKGALIVCHTFQVPIKQDCGQWKAIVLIYIYISRYIYAIGHL